MLPRRPLALHKTVATTIVTFALTFALPLADVACSSTEEGVEVTVVQGGPTNAGTANVIVNDLGFVVTLTKGFMATASVEITACTGTTASVAPSWFGAGVPGGVRLAWAHSTASPTKLGEPVVTSLTAPASASTELGDLLPPPGKYCKVKHSVGAADDDAKSLPTDVAFVGKSLYVMGTSSKNGSAPVAFASSSTFAFDVEHDVAFTLDAKASPKATLTLGSAQDHWFDGIDFDKVAPDAVADAVISNVKRSLTAKVP